MTIFDEYLKIDNIITALKANGRWLPIENWTTSWLTCIPFILQNTHLQDSRGNERKTERLGGNKIYLWFYAVFLQIFLKNT